MLVSRPIPNPSNAPVGDPLQLLRLASSGVAEAVPNGNTGDVMTIVAGDPAWQAPGGGTPDLAMVAAFKAKCTSRSTIPNLSAVDLSVIAVFDFVSLEAGDVVLVKDTADPDGNGAPNNAYNGPYVVGTPTGSIAALTRAPWAQTAEQLGGMKIFVAAGSSNSGTTWKLPLPASTITVDTTSLFYKRDDLGAYFQNIQEYKPIALSVSTDSAVGEAFGGSVLYHIEHNFSGTTLKVYWEISYYITDGALTGEVRLVDKTANVVVDAFPALKSTDPVTVRSVDIVGVLSYGHIYEVELAIADGSTSADRIYVDSAFFIIRNTKD